jgi:hypothetical protein
MDRLASPVSTCGQCREQFSLKPMRRTRHGRVETYFVRRKFCYSRRCTRIDAYKKEQESQRVQLEFCPVCEQKMNTDTLVAHLTDAHRRWILEYDINRKHDEWLQKLRLLEEDEETSVQDLLFAHSWQQRFHLPRADYGKLPKRGRRMCKTETILKIRKNMVTKILRDAMTGEQGTNGNLFTNR